MIKQLCLLICVTSQALAQSTDLGGVKVSLERDSGLAKLSTFIVQAVAARPPHATMNKERHI
jgi:hypothetical protein